MTIEELYNIYNLGDSHLLYFYDKNNNNFVTLSKDIINIASKEDNESKNLNSLDNEIQNAKNILNNPKKFILFNRYSSSEILKIEKLFLRKVANPLKQKLEYNLDDYSKFLDILKNAKKIISWNNFLKHSIMENIKLWIIDNSINGIEIGNKFQIPFYYLKKIASFNPWKDINLGELIKIESDKICVYVSFFQNFGSKDINLYFGELGKSNCELVENISKYGDSNFYPSLVNRITCKFQHKESLKDEEQIIINNSKMKFVERYYPSILSCQENMAPSYQINDYKLSLLTKCLKIIYYGLIDYFENKEKLFKKTDETLHITLTSNDEIFLSLKNDSSNNLIDKHGLDFIQDKETECQIRYDDEYEVKLDILNEEYTNYMDKYYIYYLIVLNIKTEEIIFTTQAIWDGKNSPLKILEDSLASFAKKNGFAHKVYVDNFFAKVMIGDAVGKDIEVISSVSASKLMYDIVDELNYLNEEAMNKDSNSIIN